MTSWELPNYSLSYELDGDEVSGTLMAVDIDGHDLDIDLIERVLHVVPDREGVYIEDPTSWEITESWRRVVPMAHGSRHLYLDAPARGAKAVTHVELYRDPQRWCLNHLDRHGSFGVPCEQVVDGEQIVERELARADAEVDPRASVSSPCNSRLGGYIYLCGECADTFLENQCQARYSAAVAQAG